MKYELGKKNNYWNGPVYGLHPNHGGNHDAPEN